MVGKEIAKLALMSSIATAPADPTFISTGTLLAIAVTAEGCHLIKEGVKEGMKKHKERKARLAAIKLNPVLMTEYEACVRKIASCTVGITIGSVLSFALPHYSVGLVFNIGDLICAVQKLRGLRNQGAHVMVSGLSKIKQIGFGVVMKLFYVLLYLGHDFESIAEHFFGKTAKITLAYTSLPSTSNSDAVNWEHGVEHVKKVHTDMLENSPLKEFTAGMEAPFKQVKDSLGLPENWEDDETQPAGHHSAATNIFATGITPASTELVAARVLEEPVQKLIDREVFRGNINRCRLETVQHGR